MVIVTLMRIVGGVVTVIMVCLTAVWVLMLYIGGDVGSSLWLWW